MKFLPILIALRKLINIPQFSKKEIVGISPCTRQLTMVMLAVGFAFFLFLQYLETCLMEKPQ